MGSAFITLRIFHAIVQVVTAITSNIMKRYGITILFVSKSKKEENSLNLGKPINPNGNAMRAATVIIMI